MYYHYNPETREFLFENLAEIKDFPSTTIDINFKINQYRNQIFDGKEWSVIYDYRTANIYKKNSLTKIYKKLGENINEDEIIYEDKNFIPTIKKEKTENDIKQEIKLKINSFLSKTDKYFNNHPPKFNGDIDKLKSYRDYLYEFTKKEKWWLLKITPFEEWQQKS